MSDRSNNERMNIWDESWDLHVQACPCDVHFLELLEDHDVRGASIFHFGTGNHHVVGIRTAEDGHGNSVLGITASPQEYESYVALAIERPAVTRTYKAFFGDIYVLDPKLLPAFDIVTLFHLCEFRTEKNDVYGGLTDLALAEMMVDQLRPNGLILFYMGSMAFDRAKPVIAELEKTRPIERVGEYKTLLVFRKKAGRKAATRTNAPRPAAGRKAAKGKAAKAKSAPRKGSKAKPRAAAKAKTAKTKPKRSVRVRRARAGSARGGTAKARSARGRRISAKRRR